MGRESLPHTGSAPGLYSSSYRGLIRFHLLGGL